MLPEQRHRIHDSWSLAAPSADELATRFYARLFEIDPDAARLFAATDLPAQHRKFTTMLDAIVRAVDEPEQLVPAAAALARRHAAYGVRDRHYDSAGEALICALGDTLGAAFTAEVRTAWVEVYALLAAVMHRAAGRAGDVIPGRALG